MVELFTVSEFSGEGLGGAVEANDYMCSFLNFLPRLVVSKTTSMQKHTETDECFVLLEGRAMLFLSEGAEAPEEISAVALEKGKIYNIPMGIWHSPVLSEDAKVLLVENNNTVTENSPRVTLTDVQKEAVHKLGKELGF